MKFKTQNEKKNEELNSIQDSVNGTNNALTLSLPAKIEPIPV